MKLIKVCCVCSKKTQKLFFGFCSNCFCEKNSPVERIKEFNFKMCNSCKKIHYKESFYTKEEVEKLLPKWVLNYIVLNKFFSIKEVKVKDFEIIKNKINFNLEFDFKLEDLTK